MKEFTVLPELTFEVTDQYRTDKTPFDSGTSQQRSRWQNAKRRFSLSWGAAIQAEKEEIQSFFAELRGPATNFNYRPPDELSTPHDPATAGVLASGALLSRTYDYGVTWITDEGETLVQSLVKTIAVDADDLLTLTVGHAFKSVTKFGVYAADTGQPLTKQDEINAPFPATWTEPVGGLSDGAVIPAANTATELVEVYLEDDALVIKKRSAAIYSIELIFVEAFIA